MTFSVSKEADKLFEVISPDLYREMTTTMTSCTRLLRDSEEGYLSERNAVSKKEMCIDLEKLLYYIRILRIALETQSSKLASSERLISMNPASTESSERARKPSLLGVTPRDIAELQRITELADGIYRFTHHDDFPGGKYIHTSNHHSLLLEWTQELQEILSRRVNRESGKKSCL